MALEGSLQDMSLVDLFHIFRMGPKTGILLLVCGPERAVVYVAEGQLVDAVLVRGSERRVIAAGEDAVIQLLQWEDANFTFRHDPAIVERPARIFHETDWLILEGVRRRENPLRALPHEQITLDTQLEMASMPSSAESGVNLDLDQWRILSQIAISQNIREVCDKIGIAPEQAIRTVTELIAIGLLQIVPTPLALPAHTQRYATAPQRQPALAGLGALPCTAEAGSIVMPGRSLLSAIMRRVRGL
jgi:hypothetical protein